MQKNVAVSSVSPAGSSALASRILGAVVEPPKTRWNPGALLSSAFLAVEAGLVALLSPKAFVIADFGTAGSAFLDQFGTTVRMRMGDPEPFNRLPALSLHALAGSSRSRPLDFFGGVEGDPAVVEASIVPALPDSVHSLGVSLLLPQRPSLTASALAGRVDSHFQDAEIPSNFILLIDQTSGRVLVFDQAGGGAFLTDALTPDATDFVSIVTSDGGAVVVAYDLSIPAPGEPVSSDSPIWG